MKKAPDRDLAGSEKAKRAGRPASRDARLPDMSAYGRLAEYNRKRHFDVPSSFEFQAALIRPRSNLPLFRLPLPGPEHLGAPVGHVPAEIGQDMSQRAPRLVLREGLGDAETRSPQPRP